MGRKIPGRKHRGVRDIIEQNAKKERSLIDKINAPPQDPDEQPIPKSLTRLIELKRKINSKSTNEKHKIKKDEKPKQIKKSFANKPVKNVPVFKQRPGESNKRFLGRVNHMVQEFLDVNKFEQKYNVDILRNKLTGEVEDVVKKEKDEIDELMKSSKNPKSKKKKKDGDLPKLTKSQKRREKIKSKKLKKKQEKDELDFHHYKDDVKFGEVVDAPPVLTKYPRKILEKNIPAVSPNVPKFQSRNTGKRKRLSGPVQKMLEEERKLVIEAYKNRKL